MFKAKEEELTEQFDKIKGVREELKEFQKEHGIKLRYVQPQNTTHFMNRKTSNLDNKPVDYQSLNKQLVRGASGKPDARQRLKDRSCILSNNSRPNQQEGGGSIEPVPVSSITDEKNTFSNDVLQKVKKQPVATP